ncbi:predicted protein [Sclerotinia sclerotiorum 1980 UF-70]|uniref:Uncharacterized protein n=1 Tax=Sclerotinia sclerotiorum (strain ATCC 18683 / 1980 / Ss-1) TaxID=665079 RepID=A7F291_SCLS1|nr:predicted protein [Sclerotinia sclerotiorum 1980 UF-70]EDN95833.1 predicted protein [Sclerotinia sclerotiorum 1980 UF-70]
MALRDRLMRPQNMPFVMMTSVMSIGDLYSIHRSRCNLFAKEKGDGRLPYHVAMLYHVLQHASDLALIRNEPSIDLREA